MGSQPGKWLPQKYALHIKDCHANLKIWVKLITADNWVVSSSNFGSDIIINITIIN